MTQSTLQEDAPMLAADATDLDCSTHSDQSAAVEVMLADGTWKSLQGLQVEELQQLQWEQEQKFARAIKTCKPGSRERQMVTAQAYDTICTLLAALASLHNPQEGKRLLMGYDARYPKLVLQLLESQIARGFGRPQLFEIGYGSGALLEEVAGYGYRVGGLEVSQAMRDQAADRLGPRHAPNLLLGSLRDLSKDQISGRPTLAYWNDVFEHIAEDEIDDYLRQIHSLLDPRGWLVTITPNWLLRPSDVTSIFCPPRTEACGLHLKEYRLAEVTRRLKRAGFRKVATPLLALRSQFVVCGGGGRLMKQLSEPLIEKLPVKMARLLCRGFAMSCTIAMKARS
ncbi:MAG: methyltransferase domain-containing protein [Planctomycetales bacterium]|nr:methyltransferase domain-containing protein [Planctomycetales bacterium]